LVVLLEGGLVRDLSHLLGRVDQVAGDADQDLAAELVVHHLEDQVLRERLLIGLYTAIRAYRA